MNEQLREGLLLCETDLDGAIDRFAGDEELYVSCLETFLEDTTMTELKKAIATESWNDAFTAAHALKGMVVNMGFIPLFHATANAVVMLRAGKIKELTPAMREVEKQYEKLTDVIRLYLNREDA